MPRSLTMSTIVTRCQRRADKENDGSIDSSVGGEWYALISAQYAELYSLVVETGCRNFETTQQYTSTGAQTLNEPTDHFMTVGIDRILNATTGERYELGELMASERQRFAGTTGDAQCYTHVDTKYYLYPTPPAGQLYELLYVAQPPDLTTYNGGQTVDVVNPAGEEFLIWGVVVKALAKSESDVTLAIAERERHREQLVEWATLRALNQPRRRVVTDAVGDMMIDRYGMLDAFDPGGWWNR